MPYTVERTSENAIALRHPTVSVDWQQPYLLISDVHWDNPHCERALLKEHLDEAVRREAGILVFGDFFCAMQGKYDKRADKSALRPEHQATNYLDALVDTAATWLEPYSKNIVMLADGNHETAIRKHLETDLLERLCQKLGVLHMGYSGYVRFLFEQSGGSRRISKTLYWHHGSGGGGPVTKGVIQHARRAASVEADIYVTGHIHEAWQLENPVMRLSANGIERIDQQHHVQCATYKQEYTPGGGFHVERGRPPKPLGGWWLTWQLRAARVRDIRARFHRAD